jgi:hypothetical protein
VCWNSDTLAWVLNCFSLCFLLLKVHFYCTWCTEKNTGKITITCNYKHTHSFLIWCILNVMLPAGRPIFSEVARTTLRTRETLSGVLHTPWSRVLLEKLTGSQLVKIFSAFYGIRKSITALASARYLYLSSVRPIQSMPPHPTSWTSILILSSHRRLVLPSDLFP